MRVTTLLDEQLCPICGYVVDSHDTSNGQLAIPKENDYSVCLACGAVLRYGPELKLRASSVEEADRDGVGPEIRRVVAGIQHLRARDKTWPKGSH